MSVCRHELGGLNTPNPPGNSHPAYSPHLTWQWWRSYNCPDRGTAAQQLSEVADLQPSLYSLDFHQVTRLKLPFYEYSRIL